MGKYYAVDVRTISRELIEHIPFLTHLLSFALALFHTTMAPSVPAIENLLE
jgi:hypothetical protein